MLTKRYLEASKKVQDEPKETPYSLQDKIDKKDPVLKIETPELLIQD